MPADIYFFVSIFFKLNIHTYYEDDIVSQADYNYSSSLLWFQVNIIVSTDMCSFLLGHRITNADCPFHIHACAAECAHEHALKWPNLLWSAGLVQGTQLQIRVNQLSLLLHSEFVEGSSWGRAHVTGDLSRVMERVWCNFSDLQMQKVSL